MKLALTPLAILAAASCALFATAAPIFGFARSQFWTGPDLAVPTAGQGLAIHRFAANGLTSPAGLTLGDIVLAIADLSPARP